MINHKHCTIGAVVLSGPFYTSDDIYKCVDRLSWKLPGKSKVRYLLNSVSCSGKLNNSEYDGDEKQDTLSQVCS